MSKKLEAWLALWMYETNRNITGNPPAEIGRRIRICERIKSRIFVILRTLSQTQRRPGARCAGARARRLRVWLFDSAEDRNYDNRLGA
ncbi:hypothetical protein EVAR_31314_1 [Eumeta japonica]|uniref:Uncharacterized protein n=1 Tax=Eumeta variegata TaxID=151549 RepID=A0A4C1VSL3_EUMVA|nr:hypothetical protein EVAR_31314_1 [Eumeta japonica]